ncbi:hypothetical protein SAMN05421833_121158 [Microbispora rosea]|uniref:Uncharacterized protein n=1 Tax=Microbispora rosea TaxID=58117 RepID=A0A1N7FDT7_9ACTN|nr:hypothetical protein SAMN05421833_121158 [Microbispora rosea]
MTDEGLVLLIAWAEFLVPILVLAYLLLRRRT